MFDVVVSLRVRLEASHGLTVFHTTGSCQEDLSRALAACEASEQEAGERARDALGAGQLAALPCCHPLIAYSHFTHAGQLAENAVASAERAERREKEQAAMVGDRERERDEIDH